MDKVKIGLLELLTLQNTLSHPPDDSDDVLRSVMVQCSKWVEGEKHVTITINIQNNFWGDIENLYNNLVE